MADPMLDTASQRPATGLDAGARKLILRVVEQLPADVIAVFFHDLYSGYDDYFDALEPVWGKGVSRACQVAVVSAGRRATDPTRHGITGDSAVRERGAKAAALLLKMPEADFRRAIFDAQRRNPDPGDRVRITRICQKPGIPWAYEPDQGFVWVGDEETETHAVRPALAAISDPRFAGGVKSDFDSARSELAIGTPKALSKCLHQAACAVESAIKVTLDEHQVTYDEKDAAQALFDHLVAEGIVPRYMGRIALGAISPRNEKGGHGPGATPHSVPVEEAEATLASAAVAIAYLHTQLP
jgi:hypothetical protein